MALTNITVALTQGTGIFTEDAGYIVMATAAPTMNLVADDVVRVTIKDTATPAVSHDFFMVLTASVTVNATAAEIGVIPKIAGYTLAATGTGFYYKK